ncbi:unnamed protein product [Pseudo-nitzschia multistriata]|uniref:ATP-dependent DNA helicase n=1 Tax=Pseudo-nitzschia multistriata TaxID=183589 RepID=A0A448YYC2_9STRA|nr:unnamed protein product [Pseudo-nitzschia multistriata]
MRWRSHAGNRKRVRYDRSIGLVGFCCILRICLWHWGNNILVECFSLAVGRRGPPKSLDTKLLFKTTSAPTPYFGDFITEELAPYFGDDDMLKKESDDDEDFPIFEEEANPKRSDQRNRREEYTDIDHGRKFNPFAFPPFDAKKYNDDGSPAQPEDGILDDEILSAEQTLALKLITEGRNVFVTGVAGTGKSLVLRKTLEYVQEVYEPNEYVAMAPTGSTAIALEGQTVHSFAGIGIPKIYKDFKRMKTNKNIRKRWEELQVLILDEVSMISGEFFDSLSKVVSDIRNDPRPFGGIQLIVCGDFLQLPPISPRQWEVDQTVKALQEREGLETPEEARDWLFLNRGFCFQSVAWKEANFELVELNHVFRQRNEDFVRALQDIRVGNVTPETIRYLRENCERPLPENDLGIQPTILHSKNIDVARENLVDLNKLSGDTVSYEASDAVEPEKGVGPWVKKDLENNSFFRSCLAERKLQLKIGAQVMLIRNLSQNSGLVNGSRGTIVGFREVKSSSSSTGLNLLPGVTKYPVVQFKNGLQQVITPQKFQSRILGKGKCIRTAIPLKLAWAITAHKAQGLTMDYVIADVGQVFAEAQLYVALSRASDATGLEIRNFSRNRVRANALALRFHGDPEQKYPFWWDSDGSRPMILMESPSESLPEKSKKERPSETAGFGMKAQVRGVKKKTGSNAPRKTPERAEFIPRSHRTGVDKTVISATSSKTPEKLPKEQNSYRGLIEQSQVVDKKIRSSNLRKEPKKTSESLGMKRISSQTEMPIRSKPIESCEAQQDMSEQLHEPTLKSRKVVELKQMLRERGLKVSGRKAELIERLVKANGIGETHGHALEKRRVFELQCMLRAQGLKVWGTKAELIERLVTSKCIEDTNSGSNMNGKMASYWGSSRKTNTQPSEPLHEHALAGRKVFELKGMLRELGLKVTGRKSELIDRLIAENQ